MAHHRNTPLHEKRDRLGETGAALHLDRAGAGLLQHAGGAHECLLRARLVGAERHVHDDEGPGGAADHGLRLDDHHLQVTGRVVSIPCMTMPRESPTRMKSQ